jgi:flagellar basal-body rod protein FlgB
LAEAPPAAKKCRAAFVWRGPDEFTTDSEGLPHWQLNCFVRNAMLDRLAGQIEHYMDLLSTRQKLVASNIANADTPGYHTQDIDFQSELQNAISGTPNVMDVAGLQMKNDGNNVSLDRESRLLSENALRFNVAANLLRVQISSLRSAIKEGQSS